MSKRSRRLFLGQLAAGAAACTMNRRLRGEVTATYPPTLLIHGTKDTDVPYEQSGEMAKELARQKVVHELITVPDAGHDLRGHPAKEIAKIHDRVVAFVNQHARKKP